MRALDQCFHDENPHGKSYSLGPLHNFMDCRVKAGNDRMASNGWPPYSHFLSSGVRTP